ncbi:MAG TPA: glutamine--fructose-6-phosphate aminotransferase, partial [Actinomycetota bacterium]|nr:glutamine--fructose-6-phosphate aminotransferase [Actinomycetota bacterium]
MCGIVGYVGGQDATQVVVDGLRRLEYRGYDSAGVAVVTPAGVQSRKRAGKLANLEKALAEAPLPDTTVGIGHTRWATHGAPNDVNAHPHLSEDGSLAVIHNGIIENFAELRALLQADGVTFLSETDTEVAAHLLAKMVAETGTLTEAMQATCRQLRGAFTLVAASAEDPDTLVGARRNSPLVVGLGDGETFLA